MRTFYIRELSFHTPASLARLLQVSIGEALRYIGLLCAHGVLKLRTTDDKKDYDIWHEGPVRGSYQFAYVGLVLIDDLCIIVYPKYLPEIDAEKPDDVTRNAMRQVFRVLRKIGGSYSDIAAMTEEGMRANDRLALMLMLLEMYAEYGVYSNYVRSIEDNGPGGISWERTIAATLPFVRDNRPIYFNYKTVETDPDTSDFVTRLHRAVLTECSMFMQGSGLASLLALDEVWLSDSAVEDFGDADFLAYRLDRERAVQFVTWKQDVIGLLLRYIGEDNPTVRQDTPLCLGTSCFYHVWEEACKVALGDVLESRLGDLGLNLVEPFDNLSAAKLIDIIPRPQWENLAREDGCGEVATLIPDTVLLHNNGRGDYVFAILDAKYYTPELGSKVTGVPGVESVSKQFLYQAAFRRFVMAHGFTRVVNAFLAPSAAGRVEHLGRVRFPGVIASEEPPFSNSVELYALPAREVFDSFITGMPLSDAMLLTIIGSPYSD